MRWFMCWSVVLLLVGCNAQSVSMNQTKSVLRSAADNSLTAYIDTVEPEETAERRKERAKEIATELLNFLETGDVVHMTEGELANRLVEIIPEVLSQLTKQLLASVVSTDIDVEGHIGENNVKRLKAVCYGVLQGVTHYDMGDRK